MVIATLLLLCSIPQMDDTAKVVNDSPAVNSDSASKDSTLVASSLPSAPAPKVKTDAEAIAPAEPFQPVKVAYSRPQESPRQRKIWYGLLIAGHMGVPIRKTAHGILFPGPYMQFVKCGETVAIGGVNEVHQMPFQCGRGSRRLSCRNLGLPDAGENDEFHPDEAKGTVWQRFVDQGFGLGCV